MANLQRYFETRFTAFQRCVIPLSKEFSVDQQRQSLQLVHNLIRTRPAGDRLRVIVFLFAVDVLSVLSGGRWFRSLSADRQNRILGRLFRSSVPLIRKGFWGLNTLAKLGAYGQPSVYERLGYRMKPGPQ